MPSESQLITLLDSSEGRLIERKISQPNQGEIKKTLVAFANSVNEPEFAVLFIGVGDNGVKRGVLNADAIQLGIAKIAKDDCFPPVQCDFHLLRISDIEIVAVVIGASKKRPHFTGHAYVRNGSRSINASETILNDLIASRNDKARLIQAERGKLVKLTFVGKAIQRKHQTDSGRWMGRNDHDYRVLDCSALLFKFQNLTTGYFDSAPMDTVSILDDSPGLLRLQIREM